MVRQGRVGLGLAWQGLARIFNEFGKAEHGKAGYGRVGSGMVWRGYFMNLTRRGAAR